MSEQSLIPVPSSAAGLGTGTFDPAGRQVDAGRGIEWLKRGWELFKQNPGIWIAITVIGAVIYILLSFIPLIGPLVYNLLLPVFIGGIVLGCHALTTGGKFGIEALFAGFKQNTAGNLVLVGVFCLVGIILIAAAMFLMFVITVGSTGLFSAGGMTEDVLVMVAKSGGLLIILIGLALMVPLSMAFYFAPPLVVLRNVAPFDALKVSFFACLKNFLPFLVYGVIGFVLLCIAMIPFGLGLLVLLPVLMGASYASYIDIFE